MKHVSPEALEGTPVSNRETHDNYHAIITLIGDRRRVVNCKDDIQWIVQRRRGRNWDPVAYCRRRDTVIRKLEQDGPLPDTIRELLMDLPAIHP